MRSKKCYTLDSAWVKQRKEAYETIRNLPADEREAKEEEIRASVPQIDVKEEGRSMDKTAALKQCVDDNMKLVRLL